MEIVKERKHYTRKELEDARNAIINSGVEKIEFDLEIDGKKVKLWLDVKEYAASYGVHLDSLKVVK